MSEELVPSEDKPVAAQPVSYLPGDVVNGHVLTNDGRWVPVAPESPIAQPVIVNMAAPYAAGPQKMKMSYGEHAIHAIITLFTCGLWLPVWIYKAMKSAKRFTY